MAKGIEVGGLPSERGTKTFGRLKVCTMADGSDLSVPIHIISGARPGPKLTVMATQHGYEVRPIAAVMELVKTLDPAQITGDLVMIPVANPVAFEGGTRCTWVDGIYGDSGNMNRLWPGRADGWLTQRVCWAISQQVFPGSDCIVDLHDGTEAAPGLRLYYGYAPNAPGELGTRLREISLAFGMEILMGKEPHQQVVGTLSEYADKAGIPHYACELGDFWGLEDERSEPLQQIRSETQVGVTGVTNLMKLYGMLPGEPERPRTQVRVTPEINIRPSHGGLFRSHFGLTDIGRVLPKDTLLGEIISPFTFEVIDEMRTPFARNLLIATTVSQPVVRANAGDYGYLVADWDTAEFFRS